MDSLAPQEPRGLVGGGLHGEEPLVRALRNHGVVALVKMKDAAATMTLPGCSILRAPTIVSCELLTTNVLPEVAISGSGRISNC
ncbi:MAG: hypothetical protein C4341_05270 [Armatimonadota bacterium]